MNFRFYVEKLLNSGVFKNFIEKNKDAYPCSGFFIIDKEKKDDQQHFDYYIPSLKKMFSFKLENEIQILPIEIIDPRIPEEVSLDSDFDFKDIEDMIQKEMDRQRIDKKLQKIILSLQKLDADKKDYLVGTAFVSGMGMIKIQIDISEMKIIEFEKKSFFDFLKKG